MEEGRLVAEEGLEGGWEESSGSGMVLGSNIFSSACPHFHRVASGTLQGRRPHSSHLCSSSLVFMMCFDPFFLNIVKRIGQHIPIHNGWEYP